MHILIINSEYPPIGGGAGNASAHIADQLEKMGHVIAIVTSRFGQFPHKEQKDNLTVYRIPSLRRRQDRSNPLEQIVFILFASLWTLSLVPHFKPNATLAFFGVPSGAIALLLKKVYKTPYVISLRGGDVPGFRPYDFHFYHKVIAPFLRIIWKNAAAVIALLFALYLIFLDPKTKLFLVALMWCRPWLLDPSAASPLPRTPEIARAALEVTGAHRELERFESDPEFRDRLSARVAEHIKVLRRKIAERGLAGPEVRLSDEVAVRILIEHGIVGAGDLRLLADPAWCSRQEDLWWDRD